MNEYVEADCPRCYAKYPMVTREGARKTTAGAVHRYYCNSCQRYFSERKFPGTKHAPKIIFTAVSLYNLGHTLASTANELRRQHHVCIQPSTIHSWIARYSDACTFHHMRKRYSLDSEKLILSRRFEHEQVYQYRLHTLKTNIMAKSLPAIGKYLYYLIKVGDLRVFDSGNRCSEMAKSQPPKEMMTGPSPMSIATKLCQMGLETAAHNRERHDAVENFFITNDSATVATEVPVFASADEMRKVRADWNLGDLHGHIDILQWRNGRIFILDYKPDMKDEAATHHQLSFYARLLSIRTSVPMSNIRCGYFNEHVYKEFDAVM